MVLLQVGKELAEAGLSKPSTEADSAASDLESKLGQGDLNEKTTKASQGSHESGTSSCVRISQPMSGNESGNACCDSKPTKGADMISSKILTSAGEAPLESFSHVSAQDSVDKVGKSGSLSKHKLSANLKSGSGSAFQNVVTKPQEQYTVTTATRTIAVIVPMGNMQNNTPRKYKPVQPKPLPSPAKVDKKCKFAAETAQHLVTASCKGKKRHQSELTGSKRKRVKNMPQLNMSELKSATVEITQYPPDDTVAATWTENKCAKFSSRTSELCQLLQSVKKETSSSAMKQGDSDVPRWQHHISDVPNNDDANRIRQLLQKNLPEEACPSQISLDAEVAQTFGFHSQTVLPRQTRSATPTHQPQYNWDYHSVPASPAQQPETLNVLSELTKNRHINLQQGSNSSTHSSTPYMSTPATTPGNTPYPQSVLVGDSLLSRTATPIDSSMDGSGSFSQQDMEQIASIIEQNPEVLASSNLPDEEVASQPQPENEFPQQSFVAPNVNPFYLQHQDQLVLARESPVLQQRASETCIPPDVANRLVEKYLMGSRHGSGKNVAQGKVGSGDSVAPGTSQASTLRLPSLEALLKGPGYAPANATARSRHNSSQSMPSFTPRTTPVPEGWNVKRPATALGQAQSAEAMFHSASIPGSPHTQQHPGSWGSSNPSSMPPSPADTHVGTNWSSPMAQSPPEQMSVPPSPQSASQSAGSSWSLPNTPVPPSWNSTSNTNTFIPISPHRTTKCGSVFTFTSSTQSSPHQTSGLSNMQTPGVSPLHSPHQTPVPPGLPSPRQTPVQSPIQSPRQTPVPGNLTSPRQTPLPPAMKTGSQVQWSSQRRSSLMPPQLRIQGKQTYSSQAMSPPESKHNPTRARHSSLQSSYQKTPERRWSQRRLMGSVPSSPVPHQLYNSQPGNIAVQLSKQPGSTCVSQLALHTVLHESKLGSEQNSATSATLQQDLDECESVALIKDYLKQSVEPVVQKEFQNEEVDKRKGKCPIMSQSECSSGSQTVIPLSSEQQLSPYMYVQVTQSDIQHTETGAEASARRNLTNFNSTAESTLPELLTKKLHNRN